MTYYIYGTPWTGISQYSSVDWFIQFTVFTTSKGHMISVMFEHDYNVDLQDVSSNNGP